MTLAIINDYVLNRRVTMFLGDDDFEIVDRNWDASDSLLSQLQHTQTFAGRTTWSALDPFHYRVMIVRNIAKLLQGAAPGSEIDLEGETVRSLNFLVCAIIRCLEKRAESQIEVIRLARVGDSDLTIEYEAVLAMEVSQPKKKVVRPDFSVVVDNTDRE